MSDEIREQLEGEIKSEIQALNALAPGSKEKSSAIDDLVKLYKLKIEEVRNDQEFNEKRKRRLMESKQFTSDYELKVRQLLETSETRENDERFKNEQLTEQIKDKYFKLGIATAEIILPLIFYAVWMRRGFKFEENGIYTSATFKNLFNRFKPTKK